MRFTASLANLVMKMWDCKFAELTDKLGINIKLYVRYVDDCRIFLYNIKKGWIWSEDKIVFSESEFERDDDSIESATRRTTELMTGMMCYIAENLKFTGEDSTQFDDETLPTLDTALWVQNGVVQHKFYEKPTVGNQVLHRDTSLPTACIRASLVQDTVRRLMNCSTLTGKDAKTEALNKFASKLVNSGHSCQSSRIIIVHGVTKYLHKVKLSMLPRSDPRFEPLYFDKLYKEDERQCDKYLAKMSWFKDNVTSLTDSSGVEIKLESWKSNLHGVWRGSTRGQKRVPGMDYSTILQVPNSSNSVLLNNLMKIEENLA